MPRNHLSIVLAASTLLASLAADSSAQTAPEHIPLRRSSQLIDAPGGVNTSLPRLPYLPWNRRWWTRIFDGGFKYVRIGQYEDTSDLTGWDWVEHTKGQFGVRPEVDDYVNSLLENGTVVELQLLYGNPIYTSPAGKRPDAITPTPASVHNRDLGLYSIFWPPKTPDQISAFLRYTTWMVNHFKGRVVYYSLWNEEDGTYWNQNPSPEEYGALLGQFVKVVHKVDPTAKIVYGGQATLSLDFARRALETCRCTGDIDVFAYHNYPGGYASNAPPETMDGGGSNSSTSALRKAVTSSPGVRPNIQFWMDEYNSMPSLSPEMNEAIQAKYIPRTLVYNWAQGIPTFIWELINDTSTSEGDNFGIVHGMMFNSNDFVPRPVFYTTARIDALFGNTHRDREIAIKTIDSSSTGTATTEPIYAYGFRSSTGKALVAYWRAERVHPKRSAAATYIDLELRKTAIEHPILIDVDADRITALEWDASTPGNLRHIPLRDSVMAIADRTYFDWQTLPEVPSCLVATAHSHSISLRWTNGNDDPQAFVIERRAGFSGTWNTIAKLRGGSVAYEDAPPRDAKTVSYRVRARNSSSESGYSNIATIQLVQTPDVRAH